MRKSEITSVREGKKRDEEAAERAQKVMSEFIFPRSFFFGADINKTYVSGQAQDDGKSGGAKACLPSHRTFPRRAIRGRAATPLLTSQAQDSTAAGDAAGGPAGQAVRPAPLPAGRRAPSPGPPPTPLLRPASVRSRRLPAPAWRTSPPPARPRTPPSHRRAPLQPPAALGAGTLHARLRSGNKRASKSNPPQPNPTQPPRLRRSWSASLGRRPSAACARCATRPRCLASRTGSG